MGSDEQAAAAAGELRGGDGAERREAARTLRDLARRRTSLLTLRESLVAALGDPDEEVRASVAVALLIDAWRFSGLLPIVDDLERRLGGPQRPQALQAAVHAAGLLSDFGRATQPLIDLLAQDLPDSAALISRLAGQGADLKPIISVAAAHLGGEVPAPGDAMAGLWLAALARAEVQPVGTHLQLLRRWLSAECADWRYDDLRYRSAEQVVRTALATSDRDGVRVLAESPFPAVREATLDTLAASWSTGRDAALAAELLSAHMADSAGGVRYAAIRGMARAAAAGVELPVDCAALLAALPSAQYIATGWAYPLDSTAVSDLRSESAAADLASVLATRSLQTGDRGLQNALRQLDQPDIAEAVRSVLGGSPT